MEIKREFDAWIIASRANSLVPAIGAVWVGSRGTLHSTMHGMLPRERIPRWHLGSCTKAFTATLFARLVERGRIGFETTLAEALPDLASQMTPVFQQTSVHTLLTHTAGVARDPALSTFRALRRSKASIIAQRRLIVSHALRETQHLDTGYSNLGYILVGAVIEEITGRPWEISLQQEVFDPLGISHFGFGGLGAGHLMGHRRLGEVWWPDRTDNPEAYGPAGRVNLSLRDWGHFLNAQLRPQGFISEAAQLRLHTPARNGFGMGWRAGSTAGRKYLTHAGSNTAWFARATLLPEQGVALGIVCNAFDERVEKAVDDLSRELITQIAS